MKTALVMQGDGAAVPALEALQRIVKAHEACLNAVPRHGCVGRRWWVLRVTHDREHRTCWPRMLVRDRRPSREGLQFRSHCATIAIGSSCLVAASF